MDLDNFDLDSMDTCIMVLSTIAITFVHSLLHPFLLAGGKNINALPK